MKQKCENCEKLHFTETTCLHAVIVVSCQCCSQPLLLMFDMENQSEAGFQYGRLSFCLPWVVGKGRYFRRVILLSVFSTNETNEQTLLLLDHACLSRWQQTEQEAKPLKMKTCLLSIAFLLGILVSRCLSEVARTFVSGRIHIIKHLNSD